MGNYDYGFRQVLLVCGLGPLGYHNWLLCLGPYILPIFLIGSQEPITWVTGLLGFLYLHVRYPAREE